jgi:hypothetical protein
MPTVETFRFLTKQPWEKRLTLAPTAGGKEQGGGNCGDAESFFPLVVAPVMDGRGA